MTLDEDYALTEARNHKVVKDNRLIQKVTRRKYELTAQEQKIIGFIISLIKPPKDATEKPQYRYTFDVRTFCKVCGLNYDSGKNYADVKAALQKIADNGFWIDEGDSELYFQWIVSPRIYKKTGKVSVRITEEVMPYLWNLRERFVAYELYQTLAMKSTYSIELFELLKSYAFRKKITVSIDDLRKYFGLGDKYKAYRDFKRRVVDPAVKEINEYTDLFVSYDPVRRGNPFAALTFTIEKKGSWEGLESYRRAMAEMNGLRHSPGQVNLFEFPEVESGDQKKQPEQQ